MTAFSVQYAQVSGRPLAYLVAGGGQPLVVLQPSLLESVMEISDWTSFIERLASRFEVVVVDSYPGMGTLSPGAIADLSTRTAMLAELLEQLDLRSTTVLGIARGVPIAISLSHARPERISGLVLWSGLADLRLYAASERVQAMEAFSAADWELFMRASTALMAGANNEAAADRTRDAWMRHTTPEMFYSGLRLSDMEDASALVGELQMPTLVVHRREAGVPDGAQIAGLTASVPDGTLRLLSGSAVYPELGDQAEAVELISAFAGLEPHDQAHDRAVQTILFTDLAGSTSMQSRLGDEAARNVLRAHDAAVRQAIEEFNGREMKHTGDGMMTAFGSAADAVNCALTVRRDIATYNDSHEGEELRVRFGLNAGEPIAEDDDLFGLSVTLAARIGDWGEPGQVLCSNVVRELLLGKEFKFTSVGSAELKGLDEPVPLYQVLGQ